jgi:uncharacterized membrane protein YeaQ/YmgE (transglycosylase-associated protein family)
MSFIWMLIAGLIAGTVAKMLMPRQGTGGLFVLGIGGSMIAGMMQYSIRQPIGFLAPVVGSIILLTAYAIIARRKVTETEVSDETRRAA